MDFVSFVLFLLFSETRWKSESEKLTQKQLLPEARPPTAAVKSVVLDYKKTKSLSFLF